MGMFLGCVTMPWNDFEYDEITGQYEIENATFESIDNAETITDFDSVMLKFENGKLINYEAQYHEPSYPEDTFYISMSFTDYGTTSVTFLRFQWNKLINHTRRAEQARRALIFTKFSKWR